MIIDCILDRRDGSPYDEYTHLKYMYDEAMIFRMDYLSGALDYGNNEDIQNALCEYIKRNKYNESICDYIKSVVWVTD